MKFPTSVIVSEKDYERFVERFAVNEQTGIWCALLFTGVVIRSSRFMPEGKAVWCDEKGLPMEVTDLGKARTETQSPEK